MSLSDFFFVESTNKYEADCYKNIISDTISDVRLSSSIDCIKSVIIPETSLFILVSLLKISESNVYISDICKISYDSKENNTFLVFEIENEKYIPELTYYLWNNFSRSLVNQKDRWTIEVDITNKEINIENIEKYVLENKSLGLQKNMIELSIRSCPEGFKVRYYSFLENKFLFLASEEPIKYEFIEKANNELLKLQEIYNNNMLCDNNE